MPAGKGTDSGGSNNSGQRTTFRPPWVKEGPNPLPMPSAPWTFKSPNRRDSNTSDSASENPLGKKFWTKQIQNELHLLQLKLMSNCVKRPSSRRSPKRTATKRACSWNRPSNLSLQRRTPSAKRTTNYQSRNWTASPRDSWRSHRPGNPHSP